MRHAMRRLLGRNERSYRLGIPREQESEHVLILGDTGTGKSQLIHHFLKQISERRPHEAVVCYDPEAEFIEHHFNRARGDVVLNPLDMRFPFWSPAAEIFNPTDRELIAESFLPARADPTKTPGDFFVDAARGVLNRMLEFEPTGADLVSWMESEEVLDHIAAKTEHAHLIDKGARGQRAGVLATLALIGKTLRLLPAQDECRGAISLTAWAKKRRGWLFITSTHDTRDALRPLQAVFINILIKRLMSVDRAWAREHPCWLIADEVHSLKRLPALAEGLTEGRKYQIKIIQGTQKMSQYEVEYGRTARAMLAAPHLKIFFRSGEPESARWVSDTIGEEENERPRIGTTATVDAGGRDSINYTKVIERRAVVSKEQIMALRNMSGYWKHENNVVPFRFERPELARITDGYLPRRPPEVSLITKPPRPNAVRPNKIDKEEKKLQTEHQTEHQTEQSLEPVARLEPVASLEVEGYLGSSLWGME
ncbi:MAG: type IV secretion system DNA-binding domain-containing protein [Pyrinomonadaceae bacterium]